jgi:hypothetical protein
LLQSENLNTVINRNSIHRVACTYWKTGDTTKANIYFNRQIDKCLAAIELKDNYYSSRNAFYDLAAVYAFQGERDKAYENLRIWSKRKRISSWMVVLPKSDPLFESIQNESEFQQIFRDLEVKYQAEHERVRQWLEENDMI